MLVSDGSVVVSVGPVVVSVGPVVVSGGRWWSVLVLVQLWSVVVVGGQY